MGSWRRASSNLLPYSTWISVTSFSIKAWSILHSVPDLRSNPHHVTKVTGGSVWGGGGKPQRLHHIGSGGRCYKISVTNVEEIDRWNHFHSPWITLSGGFRRYCDGAATSRQLTATTAEGNPRRGSSKGGPRGRLGSSATWCSPPAISTHAASANTNFAKWCSYADRSGSTTYNDSFTHDNANSWSASARHWSTTAWILRPGIFFFGHPEAILCSIREPGPRL